MSKKRFRFRNILIVTISLIILIYLFRRYYSNVKVDILEYDEIEETITVNGIIVKDEEIVYSDRSGTVNYHYNEGQKVSVGAHLADISSNDGSENKKIYSPKSGFVTYFFDGLEDKFRYSELSNLTPSKFQHVEESAINTSAINNVNNNDKLVKVINDFNYYMVCLVNNVDIDTYKEGIYISVRFEDNDRIVYGSIEKINSGNDGSVLVIRFDDFFHKIYNKRMVKASLVKNLYKGIKVDKSAIIEKDGIKGVYIKDVSNIIKFLPVEILGSNEKYHIVSQGTVATTSARGTIYINEEYYYTVKVFDKLVLKPDSVYEGQIVD